ncbi:MAG: type I restriction endonuclease subunit R, partial [Candidatus Scalindua sp.]|nr:type I restriction endonuclease subunit R [Candidatus Scalindua sp.]
MTDKITEDAVELLAIDLLEEQDYSYIFAPTIAPESDSPERLSFSDVVLIERLRNAIDTINPDIPLDAREQALKDALNLPSQDLVTNNEAFHLMLADGIEVEYNVDGNLKGGKVWLIDYDNLNENDFLVCNQFTIIEENVNKRPDIVIFVNGLPLVVIELKNAADENATVKKAYTQLQNYKKAVPSLFYYNSLLVASDGFDAKVGSLTSGWSRFHAWKSIDGEIESSSTTPQMETLIRGMLRKDVLIDLIRHFTVFEKFKKEDTETGITTVTTEKKIAAYHQYYAVNKAVVSTKKAVSEGDGKGGVIWHTQGS